MKVSKPRKNDNFSKLCKINEEEVYSRPVSQMTQGAISWLFCSFLNTPNNCSPIFASKPMKIFYSSLKTYLLEGGSFPFGMKKTLVQSPLS
jgi:hypothetical protein